MDTPLTDSQALQQGAQLEEFVIERVLGAGGFGITYLARDTSLGRRVVIKENLPTQFAWRETATGTVRPRHSTTSDAQDYEWSMKNFLREAETLASLDHSGIVRVLRKFETNGTAYFVMPFVEGVPFDSLIEERSAKNKPFTQEELLGLTTRMLDALGYLHDRGIYHRDIKPANILITDQGVPVLIDFGSARQRLSERSMTVIESPGYTPFEQLQSRGNVGPWSDLYALGATLAKAITFETPPKAADRMMGDPWQGLASEPWTQSYAGWLLQAIDRAMAVDPRQRWQSAREWTDFLNGGNRMPVTLFATRPPPPIPANQPPSIPSPQRRQNPDQDKTTSSPPSHVSKATPQVSNSPQIRSWEESYVASHCPHCGQRVRFQMKALKQRILNCSFCGKEIALSSLETLYPEDVSRYPVKVAELLFSYRGRVGRREIWMLMILPQLVLSLAVISLASINIYVNIFILLIWISWIIFVCMPITVKRLHDFNKSGHLGWIFFASFILFLFIRWEYGIIFIVCFIYLGFFPGSISLNKYGVPICMTRSFMDK